MWTGRAAGDASFCSVHFFWPEAGASPPPWGRGGRHVASQDCALVSFLPAFWGTVCPSASLGLVTSAVLCSRPRESDLLDNYHFIFHHGHPLGTALSDPLCFFLTTFGWLCVTPGHRWSDLSGIPGSRWRR